MRVRRQKQSNVFIIWFIFALMLLGMGILLSELWQLQVPRRSTFEKTFHNQSVRRVRLPAVRGKIYDTKGVVLADSIPNYCIAIYTEELRAPRSTVANTLELVDEIRSRIGSPPKISYKDIKQHLLLTPDKPLIAWENLTDEEITKWRRKFEIWTAPPKGSLKRKKVPGLNLGKPVVNRSIIIDTSEILNRKTSTAANTLELVYEISARIGIPRAIKLQNIKDHIYARRPLPLLAWEHLTKEQMARWADSCSDLTASDIYCKSDRFYPKGKELAHLLGFTLEAAAIAKEETGERIHFDMRGIKGVKGLEGTYNDLLKGNPGSQLVQIDVSGFHYRDLHLTPPRNGGDLQLTIDINIQRFAMEALAMRQTEEDPEIPVRGAVVILDPNNGDVLAMVSAPSFNPNSYMNSKRYRQSLLKDPYSRTYHRAVFGQYPPGSTFKPVAALGVLKENPEYSETIHDCINPYKVAKIKKRCWVHRGGGTHGEINIREALMYSCNVFMFEMVQAVGYDPIYKMARQFGLGQYAGLFPDLDKEPVSIDSKYGNLPAKARNVIDACNLSIGQGAITTSPLQMAMVAATIANGGTLYRPRLIKKWKTDPDKNYQHNPPWAIRRIDIPMDILEIVRGGMYDVVQHTRGTAKTARVPGIEIAGKTGSAQFPKGKTEDGKTIYGTHTWMISYAPYDFPRYAIAFLVEDGASGGRTVGPRLSKLYQKIFEYDGTLAKEEIQ